MPRVIAVRFREAGKLYYFSPNNIELHIGDAVIVETSIGIDLAHVAEEMLEVPQERIREPFCNILRKAESEDLLKYEEKREKERDAYSICTEKVEKHKLEMNLVEAEYSFDGKKLIFYFTADGRVDFRDLVKELASIFRTRIELRQIGVRDQARMAGGLGLCGRELCCCSFLSDFAPVSIKMAKTQGLSMNPNKISGACGRLMCCLKFEQNAYEDAQSRLPEQGDFISTSQGKGIVQSVDYLKETVRVVLERDGSTDIYNAHCSEVEIISSKRKKKQAPVKKCSGCSASDAEKSCQKKKTPEKNKNYSSGDSVEHEFKKVAEEPFLDI